MFDLRADEVAAVILAALNCYQRAPMPLPGMPAVISKMRKSYRAEAPSMIEYSFCVRC
jgi:hypothetical protein